MRAASHVRPRRLDGTELEAELTGDRTRVALAAAKAKGVQLGRRPTPLPARVGRNMESIRSRGLSLRAIANHLNEQSISALQGGRWHANSVSRALDRQALKRQAPDPVAAPKAGV